MVASLPQQGLLTPTLKAASTFQPSVRLMPGTNSSTSTEVTASAVTTSYGKGGGSLSAASLSGDSLITSKVNTAEPGKMHAAKAELAADVQGLKHSLHTYSKKHPGQSLAAKGVATIGGAWLLGFSGAISGIELLLLGATGATMGSILFNGLEAQKKLNQLKGKQAVTQAAEHRKPLNTLA